MPRWRPISGRLIVSGTVQTTPEHWPPPEPGGPDASTLRCSAMRSGSRIIRPGGPPQITTEIRLPRRVPRRFLRLETPPFRSNPVQRCRHGPKTSAVIPLLPIVFRHLPVQSRPLPRRCPVHPDPQGLRRLTVPGPHRQPKRTLRCRRIGWPGDWLPWESLGLLGGYGSLPKDAAVDLQRHLGISSEVEDSKWQSPAGRPAQGAPLLVEVLNAPPAASPQECLRSSRLS